MITTTQEHHIMSSLNVAVVGLGAIGREHCGIYSTLRDVTLAAVVDPVARPDDISRWPDAKLKDSVDEVLADDSIDAVSLCTPDHVHFDDAKKVIEAGRHLLLEKPIAAAPDQAEALVALAEGSGVVAMPGHTLRFEPRYHHARQVVSSGELGQVVHGYLRRNNKLSVAARAAGRVSVAYFLGIHDIDALQWIASANVVDVDARETRIRDASGRQAAAIMATLGLESGALIQLEAAWALPENNPTELDARFRLVGTAGELSIDSYESGIHVTSDRFALPMPAGAPMYGRAQGALREELASFVQCCLDGAPLPITMREAAQAVMVVDAIEASIKTQRTVPVRQL
jgi:predicted dehydrogenase